MLVVCFLHALIECNVGAGFFWNSKLPLCFWETWFYKGNTFCSQGSLKGLSQVIELNAHKVFFLACKAGALLLEKVARQMTYLFFTKFAHRVVEVY